MESVYSTLRFKLVALLVVAATFAAAAASAQNASAGSGYFCGPDGNPVARNGGDRCVHGTYHGDMRQVAADQPYQYPYAHCALAKRDADGGGPNLGDTACGTAWHQITTCASRGGGYATWVNQTSERHQFEGYFAFGSDCL